MVEMAIWFFLATVVVVITALLGFLVLRKGSTRNDSLGFRTGNVLSDGIGEGQAWKGKDPQVFSGRPLEFSEWQFTIEEALAVVPPADQVRFALSYLGGDARRWFMTTYPDGERPNDWTSLLRSCYIHVAHEPHNATLLEEICCGFPRRYSGFQ